MRKEERIAEMYHHIHNGGHHIEVDQGGNIEISTGNLDFGNVEVFLVGGEEFIDKFIKVLKQAQEKIKNK